MVGVSLITRGMQFTGALPSPMQSSSQFLGCSFVKQVQMGTDSVRTHGGEGL